MPTGHQTDAVTGAFSYTGGFIARRLLEIGRRVRTLTGHPDRPCALQGKVDVAALDFRRPDQLTESLRGVDTLYNTYWVRFGRGDVSFDLAVANTKTLLECARHAAVRRVVHISVTNPSDDSDLPYYKGKALAEEVVAQSRISYAIVRPTLIFGPGDILLNNIAWMLRRSPVFLMFGSGEYLVQPVHGDDVARLAVELAQSDENVIVDAAGPDTLTFIDIVRSIGEAVGSRSLIVRVPPGIALLAASTIGRVIRDVVLTRDEMTGLMRNLLAVDTPGQGRVRFQPWVTENAASLGKSYASELGRHFR